jgi:rhodanese-related sulfurtransferase
VVNLNNQPPERLARRDPVARLPRAVAGEPGLFIVDATWGLIQPLQLRGGVRTVGELEVLEHVRAGGMLIDTRQHEHVAHGTLLGAVAIRHEDIVDGLAELRPAGPVVLFCNGPRCTATPQAVAALLAAGWEAARLRYYRGSVHDWVTLGLPLTR